MMKLVKKSGENRSGGFTLVELIVVLVILGILAAIMVPALLGWIDKARNQDAILECRNVVQAAQVEATEEYVKGTLTKDSLSIRDEAIIESILELAGTNGGKIDGDISIKNIMVSRLVYKTKHDVTVIYDINANPAYQIGIGSNRIPTNGKEYHDDLLDWMDESGYLNEDGTVNTLLDSQKNSQDSSRNNQTKVLQDYYKGINGNTFPEIKADELDYLKSALGKERYDESQLAGKVWKPIVDSNNQVVLLLSNNNANGAAANTSIAYYNGSYYAWIHATNGKIHSVFVSDTDFLVNDLSNPGKQWVKLD